MQEYLTKIIFKIKEQLLKNAGYDLTHNNVGYCAKYASMERLRFAIKNKLNLNQDFVASCVANSSMEKLKYALENKLDLTCELVSYYVAFSTLEELKNKYK